MVAGPAFPLSLSLQFVLCMWVLGFRSPHLYFLVVLGGCLFASVAWYQHNRAEFDRLNPAAANDTDATGTAATATDNPPAATAVTHTNPTTDQPAASTRTSAPVDSSSKSKKKKKK